MWGGLKPDGIKKVDDHTVKLTLSAPKLDVPETLFQYPAMIMHRSFNGDLSTLKNPGTGPYKIDKFDVGKGVVLSKRDGYWQNGKDGKPLPYLDGIEYVDLGEDQTASVAALQSGQIHTMYQPQIDTYLALKDNKNLTIETGKTSEVRILRVQVDRDPWKDNKVRTAFKLCQDRAAINDKAYYGQGTVGQDIHVAAIHPDYAPIETPTYDPAKSLALLKEAGVTTPVTVKISVGTGWPDVVAYAETLKENAKAGGFDIVLDTMPNNAFWDLWDKTPVGITPWTHRPLGVTLLSLAYTVGANGKPVEWNESHWVDEEFNTLLKKAQGTVDIPARQAIMKDLERIQQERGSISVAFFQGVWSIITPKLNGVHVHPTSFHLWNEAWLDA